MDKLEHAKDILQRFKLAHRMGAVDGILAYALEEVLRELVEEVEKLRAELEFCSEV